MKNQYVGDVNDYRKYGLLRLLSDHGQNSIMVCWMLTPDDAVKRDGRKLGYLKSTESWRSYDPELFDQLKEIVCEQQWRSIDAVEQAGILPGARFYSGVLENDRTRRREYFQGLRKSLDGVDLLFFDPDNGLEVSSVKYGRKRSHKYLYLKEVHRCYTEAQVSLLIYQHFPMEKRGPYIRRRCRELIGVTGGRHILAFYTSYVVFFYVPWGNAAIDLSGIQEQVTKKWSGQFVCVEFPGTETGVS